MRNEDTTEINDRDLHSVFEWNIPITIMSIIVENPIIQHFATPFLNQIYL